MTEMIEFDDPRLADARWRKSRASDTASGCVELADLGDGRIALRNSKRPELPAHVFTRFEIACFVDGAKNGEFDDLA
jgi:hypothetical protein